MASKGRKQDRAGAEYLAELLAQLRVEPPDIKTLQELLDKRPISAVELCELIAAIHDVDESRRQRVRAEKRHEERRKAIEYARRLWLIQPRYNGAKKDFSEQVSRDLPGLFGVEAKPQTIARDWLRGCDAPSKMWTQS